MKKSLIAALIGTVLLLSGCIARPIINTLPNTNQYVPTEVAPESSQPVEIPTPTLTPTASLTPTGVFVPDEKTYGPFVFGQYTYYLYIESLQPGSRLKLINALDGRVVLDDLHTGMLSLEKTFLSASIMDLNFDNIPDFSYSGSADNKRTCWLADGSIDQNGDIVINSYTYNESLSKIPQITRCFETQTIYGLDVDGTNALYSYKYSASEKNVISKDTELTQFFEWNIDKISQAIAGQGALILPGTKMEVRGVECQTYIIAGYLTVAEDGYGGFYIKDLPQDGFYRLSLNPSGNWSKSEKVTAGMELPVYE